MSGAEHLTNQELADELARRGMTPACRCHKWRTYFGVWDSDGYTLRCHGCLRAVGKCTC